ncbi:MAG: DUF962 family protein [Legionella sp. 40-6]|nr:DUF962 domain-containing protein [Legionella sp.]OJY42795.1 MAG: DUF962 family protein [Legionella sp. 40-6]
MDSPKKYKSFAEFYPFYLSQHRNKYSRRLHVVGTFLVILSLLLLLLTGHWFWLLLMPIAGYGFAWIGHFLYEKNKPATFEYPLYSLMGDFKMFWQVLKKEIKI